MKRKHQRWYDKEKGKRDVRNIFAIFVSIPIILLMGIIMFAGTRILFNPTEMEVTKCGVVTMTRSYPMERWFGYPIVRYTQSVKPLDRSLNYGFVCREDNGLGQRYNHDVEGVGTWDLMAFADECITENGFVYSVTYSALLFDMIPLRPISKRAIVMPSNGFLDINQCFNEPHGFGKDNS